MKNKLRNILINAALIKLEEDLAFLEVALRNEDKRIAIEKVVGVERLKKEVRYVRSNIRPENLVKVGWDPDSEERVHLNVFYMYYWMIREVI